jgi:site-specific DNA recombinase
MNPDHKPVLRCAIYTRKSSEEGLEQSFNSLDAQREACEAFITSQSQEGWRLQPARYDDGGYSGGTMERPALQRLLNDVEAGKVNVIVVYKVDRLTRSLADFAKIVEAFDARGVSFVSVTQQFNTTTSMGRLTLNVLLSFAQFEREVTGERIRDKIAASKRKGMWMGGLVPLGYDLEARKLVPNPKEAALVCKIFSLYLELGCVSKLASHLSRENLKSKVWITSSGARLGGNTFARGALYDLLQNRLYIGEIRHHKQWYAGEHEGIVARELWDKVQAQLCTNRITRRHRINDPSASLLTGFITDPSGNRFTPTFTIKNGRRYHYYVSQLAIKNPGVKPIGPTRLPACEIENQIAGRLFSFLNCDASILDGLNASAESPSAMQGLVVAAKKLAAKWPSLRPAEKKNLFASFLQRVIIRENGIGMLIRRTGLRQVLENGSRSITSSEDDIDESIDSSGLISLTIEAKLRRSGGEVHLVVPPSSDHLSPAHPNSSLIKAVARARNWYNSVLKGESFDHASLAKHAGLTERYVGKVFGCAFLAPDIVEAILEGRPPRDLTFQKLCRDIPVSWAEQRERFGFQNGTSR